MIEIKVPDLAESITEGTIASWLVQEGDTIKQGDAVAELETDKVNMEVITESDGIVAEILKQPGETARVGEVIARLREAEASEAETTPPPEEAETPKPAAGPVPHQVPMKGTPQEEGGGLESGVRLETEESSKATYSLKKHPIASPALRRYAYQQGVDLNQINTGDPIGHITTRDIETFASGKVPGSPGRPSTQQPAAATPQQSLHPIPEGQQAVSEMTSPVGQATPAVQPTPTKQPVPVSAERPTPEYEQPVERVHMSRRRQTIANHLVETQHTAAMLTTYNEVDMTAILEIRKRRKEAFKEKNRVSLGFMSFFTKAVVGALKVFPRLNAEIQGEEMVLKKYYNIGIAVATEEGLVVPVVHHADRMNFAEIERQIASLADKARNKKLELKDLQNGTFTITNGGIFGSLWSTPILNGPQVGILGMHAIKNRPVEVNGEIVLRPMMYLALSYDHRIVDGSEAVRFLVMVKEMLEDPEELLIEG